MKKVSLFSDVLGTKGYTRSSFFDSTRNIFHFIDNDIFDLFERNNFEHINYELIDPLFQKYFEENELIFEHPESLRECFPKISTDWFIPYQVSNLVVYLSNNNINYLSELVLSNNIFHINLVIDNDLSINNISEIGKLVTSAYCDSIEITYLEKLSIEKEQIITESLKSVKKIIKFNNYTDMIINEENGSKNRFVTSNTSVSLQISRDIKHYFEAQQYHTYFNKKVYISKNGKIKNAPECPENYGSIMQIENVYDFFKIVDSVEFQKYSKILKSETDVCKDCELRFMCVDNRLPIQRNKNEWFHTKECNYNPYICKWSDEEDYLSLNECNIVSNEYGFFIDHKKLEEINKTLWDVEEITE